MLDKSFTILEANAINRDTINWSRLREKVYQKATAAKSYQDVAAVYPYLFQQIGDHHGALQLQGKSYFWKPAQTPYSNQAVRKAINDYPAVRVLTIGDEVGYILLPGNRDFTGKNINADTQVIRDALRSVNTEKINKWILDLRVNTGGSMYQMLAGLADLLGDGKLGQFVNQHKQPDGAWIINEGNIYLDTQPVSSVAYHPLGIPADLPLAVLISGQTASSGEIVAIATVGRKNSVLIGEPSAGYTTANQGFSINPNAGLNLAVDYDADRRGKIYTELVRPDIDVLGGDNFEQLEKDQKVQAALRWFRSR
jgi:C-terminal processing protease CtpA/Prc